MFMWLGILATTALAPSSLLTLELRNLTVNRAALATGSEVRSSLLENKYKTFVLLGPLRRTLARVYVT